MRSLVLLAISVGAFAQLRPNLMEDAGKANLPCAEARRRRSGRRLGLRRAGVDAHRSRRNRRHHSPAAAQGRHASGRHVPRRARSARSPRRLKTGQILVDPVVKVTVVEYHSRPIAVMGAVKKPVTFQAVGVVTAAGCAGARRRTDQRCRHRNSADPGRTRWSAFPVKRLMKDADPSVNLRPAWRRRNSRAGSRQDFRGRQRAQAGRVPGARSGRMNRC